MRRFAVLLSIPIMACGGANAGRQTSGATTSPPAAATPSGTADTCALVSQNEIANAVGNPVVKGQPFNGAADCKWETENPDHVSVLLIVHRAGSIREPILCDALRKGGGRGERLEGLDVATWKFSNTLGLFNSSEFEACGPKAFLSLQLNGKRDEAALKQATLAITRIVLPRL